MAQIDNASAPRLISEFTDAELAAMVRKSYAANTRFWRGENDSRFLLLVAVPYGKSDTVETLEEALCGFFELMQADDYKERNIQVYDFEASQHYFETSLESVEMDNEAGEGDEADGDGLR